MAIGLDMRDAPLVPADARFSGLRVVLRLHRSGQRQASGQSDGTHIAKCHGILP